MKANELMIGDWVKSRGKIEQVREVYDGFICTDSFKDSHDYHFDPIPLTPEILEKNNFGVFKNKRYYIISKETSLAIKREPIIGAHGNTFLIGYLSKGNPFDWFIEITYVHELQHALRLCGIDKEIII